MDENINLNTEQAPEPEYVNLATGSPERVLPPVIAEARAQATNFSLRDTINKNYDEMVQQFLQGQEDNMRKQVAAYFNAKSSDTIRDTVAKTVKEKGYITPQEVDFISKTARSNPNTVFETAYANEYMKFVDKAFNYDPDLFIGDAVQESPEAVDLYKQIGKTAVERYRFFLKEAEDAHLEVGAQSYVGWTVDRAKELIPFYTDYKTRGLLENVPFFMSGLGGTNLYAIRQELLDMPFETMVPKFKEIMAKLKKDNPGTAVHLAMSMASMSTSDILLNNMFTAIDISMIKPTALATAARRVFSWADTAMAVRDITKAVGKVSAAETPKEAEAIALDAAGAVSEAATKKVTDSVLKEFAGKPIEEKRALDAMPSYLRSDLEAIKGEGKTTADTTSTRKGIWKSADSDYKVDVTSKPPEKGPDGRMYQEVIYDGHTTYVPLDELKITRDEKVTKTTFTPGSGISRVSQNLINKIENDSNSLITNLQNTVQNLLRVKRIPAIQATEEAIRAIKDRAKETYVGLKNSVLDVSDIVHDNIRNTYTVQLKVGNPHGELFSNFDTAKQYFKTHGIDDVKIERHGFGFYGRISIPLRETDDVIRDALLSTKNARSPLSWVNGWAGWLRTPEETMAIDHAINRKIATYAASVLLKLAKESTKDIQKLKSWALPFTKRRQMWYDWERVVKQSSEEWAPDVVEKTPQNKGYFYKTIGELDEGYMKIVKRLPSEKEIAAYFAFVRSHELDRIFREIAVQRNYTRIGGQMHMFWQPQTNPMLAKVESKWFAGVLQNDLPGGNDAVLIAIGKAGRERIVNAEYLHANARMRNAIQKGIQEGRYKVVRVIDPEQRPFREYGRTAGPGEVLNFPTNIGEARVRYIISNNVHTRNFNFGELVPRRGGPHLEYDYEWYIKQPILHIQKFPKGIRHVYEGDRTIMPIAIRAMGHDVAEKLDKVRELMAAKKVAEAKDYAINVAKLPIEWKTLRGWFVRKKVNGVLQPPRINLTEKIQVVPRNSLTEDLNKGLETKYRSTFFDGTKRGSDARQFQVEYTGQRDAWEVFSLKDEGTRHNPLYAVEPAKTIDIIPSLNRSISRIIQNTFLDDYKIFSVEHWLREAEPFLKTAAEDIRGAPFHTFTNPEWKRTNPENIEAINKLKAQHFQIRQLLGISNAADTLLQSASQKLYDSIYTKFGPINSKLNPKAVMLVAPYLISKIPDWPSFIRAMTFHSKLGMFNPVQLIVQAQTFVTIYGVAGPVNASAGTMGAFLHLMSLANKHPNILKGLDGIASKMGFKPGEWIEAKQLLDRTGFGILGGEYAMLDIHLSPKIIKSGAHNFLESGAWFFKAGEKSVRHGAWYTAYKEFRAKNPHGRITEDNLREILNRADLLSVNMSRASSSVLQSGVFSIPSQFLSYQLRAFELFTGKRLTWVEKARLFSFYAGAYGMPTATGVLGYPFGDHIRQYALENGYVMGDSYFTTLMEGVPSMLTALAVGEHYNFGDRFGTQGFETIREAMRSDRTLWDIFGGAAYSVLTKSWENSDGFRKAMMSMFRDGDKFFAPTMEDLVDLFKEISSVNNSWKFVMAVNTGKWMSGRETYLSDASVGNAITNFLTGLQPQNVSDLQHVSLSLKERKKQWEYAEGFFVKEFRRGLREMDNRNENQAQKFFTRAFAVMKILDYPQEDMGKAISRATKDYESLIDRLDWSFYLKDVPDSRKDMLLDSFRRKKLLEESKR